MQLKVLYHGNCFDGCASAALFSRFFAEREGTRLSEVRLRPAAARAGNPFPPGAFDGDVNACVDFRFSASPELHWWFDHHASAFPSPPDRAAFERDTSGQKFWDPAAPSCTGFIARTLAARFEWRADDLAELVRWADVIDAARFDSPATAVRLEEPALRIMTLLEATKDPSVPTRLIEAHAAPRPLAEIAAEPWVAGPLAPILERHRRGHRRRPRGSPGSTAAWSTIDLADTGIESAQQVHRLLPLPAGGATRWSSRATPKRTKVSVGSNPWARPPRAHDISKLCERYGGGGHPVVGAVSLRPNRLDDARRIAAEIANDPPDGAASP